MELSQNAMRYLGTVEQYICAGAKLPMLASTGASKEDRAAFAELKKAGVIKVRASADGFACVVIADAARKQIKAMGFNRVDSHAAFATDFGTMIHTK